MTLVVLFHQLRFRKFKAFYLYYACFYLSKEFPNLSSYSRCAELLPRCALALGALFDSIKGKCTGISITDSTPLAVCDNLRIGRHKVFDGMAERGKSLTGWFFGFKLHIIINQLGEITRLCLTPGNVDARKPLLDLIKGSFGRLYADKGYLSRSLKQKGFVVSGPVGDFKLLLCHGDQMLKRRCDLIQGSPKRSIYSTKPSRN